MEPDEWELKYNQRIREHRLSFHVPPGGIYSNIPKDLYFEGHFLESVPAVL